ncbi:MAG: transposase [Microbacteriaceae bacterium]|nr:transposase [Microbacteriaceae bacterium]
MNRVRAQDPEFDADYRQHMPTVERSIAWMPCKSRLVPYSGELKNNASWVNRAASINLERFLSHGLTHQNGASALG